MTNHPKLTESHDSAARKSSSRTATGSRLLRILAMPVTLAINVVRGLWFLLCVISDALWIDAVGDERHGR